ncbi:hypothetical protein [Streptomyces sp. NPDC047009]|uniref:hypothetical protein n=1 Tax=Streptomyces sp. NPDC047009 TaxID=3154496 RepID=UPI003408C9A2
MAAGAGAPVNLIVDAAAGGRLVPTDFTGLSFERGALNYGNAGVAGYFFSPENTELVALFRNARIRNLRVGAGTADQQIPPGTGSDGYKGIDQLFQFAAAAGTSVSYGMRLYNPANSPIPDLISDDAAAARYIWQRYSSTLSSFSIGNEPDWHSFHIGDPSISETTPGEPGTAYPSYLEDWHRFAAAVQEAAPGAKLSGPDTGNYGTRGGVPYVTFAPDAATGVSWTQKFTEDEGASGRIKDATQHIYVGGSPLSTTAGQAIDNMLSAKWVEDQEIGTQPAGTGSDVTSYAPYPWLDKRIVAPTVSAGLPVRLSESNDYLTGVPGASDRFAAALWALDYMHWWAARGVSGVNFHNKQWIYTDTITPALGTYAPLAGSCGPSECGSYRVSPKGYAMKAFDLSVGGEVKPIRVAKPSDVNVTAYAVGGDRGLNVTVINKTYGAGATDARVTIEPRNSGWTRAALITLDSGEPGDPSSVTATIGGAAIENSEPWQGKWTALSPDSKGHLAVTVRATTAAVIRFY